jgi:hypothetical protein
VAAGWGGDLLEMFEGCNDSWMISWHTAWDTEADAMEFRSRMEELSSTFAGTTEIRMTDDRVTVTIEGD